MYISLSLYIYIYIHMYIRIHMCVCIYIYIYTHTYIWVRGCRGERLHTRTRKRELPSEDATESPLDLSSENPLGKSDNPFEHAAEK